MDKMGENLNVQIKAALKINGFSQRLKILKRLVEATFEIEFAKQRSFPSGGQLSARER